MTKVPIVRGVCQVAPGVACIATTSIVIPADYILRNVRDVFCRPLPKKLEGQITDVIVLDKVAIFTVSALMIALGLFPIILVPMVQTGVDNILRLLGGA